MRFFIILFISFSKIFSQDLSGEVLKYKEDQIYLHKNINTIEISKGNLKDSDICFLKKT